jgi:hypothetical protein
MLRLPRRHLLSLLLAALPLATMAAPPKGGAANLAMIGVRRAHVRVIMWNAEYVVNECYVWRFKYGAGH